MVRPLGCGPRRVSLLAVGLIKCAVVGCVRRAIPSWLVRTETVGVSVAPTTLEPQRQGSYRKVLLPVEAVPSTPEEVVGFSSGDVKRDGPGQFKAGLESFDPVITGRSDYRSRFRHI